METSAESHSHPFHVLDTEDDAIEVAFSAMLEIFRNEAVLTLRFQQENDIPDEQDTMIYKTLEASAKPQFTYSYNNYYTMSMPYLSRLFLPTQVT